MYRKINKHRSQRSDCRRTSAACWPRVHSLEQRIRRLQRSIDVRAAGIPLAAHIITAEQPVRCNIPLPQLRADALHFCCASGCKLSEPWLNVGKLCVALITRPLSARCPNAVAVQDRGVQQYFRERLREQRTCEQGNHRSMHVQVVVRIRGVKILT